MIGIKRSRRSAGLTWTSRVLLVWLLVNGLLVASMKVIVYL